MASGERSVPGLAKTDPKTKRVGLKRFAHSLNIFVFNITTFGAILHFWGHSILFLVGVWFKKVLGDIPM